MKYYTWKCLSDIDGVLIPGLNGKTVKGHHTFFDAGKCNIKTFYDQMYVFDYLSPENFGEIKPEPEIITDIHMWIGEQPRRGLFFPISLKFKNLLERFNLPPHRFYTASVLFKGNFYPYFIWHCLYHSYWDYIDFDKTLYNNLNSYRRLKQEQREVKQFSSFHEMSDYSEKNWDDDWNYEKLVMKPAFKEIDYCYILGLDSGNLISERLKDAITSIGISGLEFKELPITIEFSDEV